MASGVAALVRYLPAGSPSIFYCINCLIEKAISFSSKVPTEPGSWNELHDELDPIKKLLDLLLRLLSLVDIQVSFFFFWLTLTFLVKMTLFA